MKTRIADLGLAGLRSRLAGEGLCLVTGPFSYRIHSSVPVVAEGLHRLYGDLPDPGYLDFVDFEIRLDAPSLLRRYWRPKLDFYFDHQTPFKPLPLKQAYAFLEWGMNWCVSAHVNQYLKLHAAVLEKNGHALIMPAAPGSGKSTLCAALMLSGWRVLSDEHALISLDEAKLLPVCRPISLKNESIEVIRRFDESVVLGPMSDETHKGTVTHLKPSAASMALGDKKISPAWMVFPSYQPGAETRLTERIRETAFLKAGDQSFNYSLLGKRGFEVMSRLVGACDCYNFSYSKLEEAIGVFDKLSEARA